MSGGRSRGLGLAWVQFTAVVRKESLQTLRDPRTLFMLVAAPLIQGILFGFAVNFDVGAVPIAVIDHDRGPLSREHARRLLDEPPLRPAAGGRGTEEAAEILDRGDAVAAVAFPPGFGGDLLAGHRPVVRVVVDGADPHRASVAVDALSRRLARVSAELAGEAPARGQAACPAAVSVTPRVFYNPKLESAPYVIPGILAMLLVVVTTIVSATGLSREREAGTLEQVLVTPIRPLPLLAGKLAPFLLVGLLDVLLLLAAGRRIFDVPLRGDPLALLAGTLLYLSSTLGVGLLISTLSRTQQQSFVAGFMFVLPAVMLSGILTPVRGMPGWLQAATAVNPLRHFQELARAVLLKGAGFHDVWRQLARMAAFGATVLTAASLRFHKQAR